MFPSLDNYPRLKAILQVLIISPLFLCVSLICSIAVNSFPFLLPSLISELILIISAILHPTLLLASASIMIALNLAMMAYTIIRKNPSQSWFEELKENKEVFILILTCLATNILAITLPISTFIFLNHMLRFGICSTFWIYFQIRFSVEQYQYILQRNFDNAMERSELNITDKIIHEYEAGEIQLTEINYDKAKTKFLNAYRTIMNAPEKEEKANKASRLPKKAREILSKGMEDYLCPVTFDPIFDPVIMSAQNQQLSTKERAALALNVSDRKEHQGRLKGKTVDRAQIVSCLSWRNANPRTNEKYDVPITLTPDTVLREDIRHAHHRIITFFENTPRNKIKFMASWMSEDAFLNEVFGEKRSSPPSPSVH